MSSLREAFRSKRRFVGSRSAILQTGSDERRIVPCPVSSGRSIAFLLIARKRFLSGISAGENSASRLCRFQYSGGPAHFILIGDEALSYLINVKEDPAISFRNWAQHLIRNGLQWKSAPAGYRPHKTLYSRLLHWSLTGVFGAASWRTLRGEGSKPECIMIDATHLKAHRTAAILLKKGYSPSYRANQRRAEPETAHRLRW